MLTERGEQLQTPETPVEIKRFSEEALDFLRKKGLLHYPLNGQSLQAQQLEGRLFRHIGRVKKHSLFSSSMLSEAAFNPFPNRFFLPKSNRLTLLQQQWMISQHSIDLQREFGSEEIMAVMGNAPDYTLLAFLHFDATRRTEYLFGQRYNLSYAKTKTPVSGNYNFAIVGNFRTYGLSVSERNGTKVFDHVFAVPLVVPA